MCMESDKMKPIEFTQYLSHYAIRQMPTEQWERYSFCIGNIFCAGASGMNNQLMVQIVKDEWANGMGWNSKSEWCKWINCVRRSAISMDIVNEERPHVKLSDIIIKLCASSIEVDYVSLAYSFVGSSISFACPHANKTSKFE